MDSARSPLPKSRKRHGKSATPLAPPRGDIAIIGLSCLFPGAPTLDAFWQNIVSKVDAITDAPPEAWDAEVFYDPRSTATDRVYAKRGGFLGPIATFNPLKHGIMPLAVEGGEPDQWLALQLAHDALADAGYLNNLEARHSTAVILGKGTYINRGNLSLIQHGLMVEQILQILRSLHADWNEEDFQAIRAELKASLPPLNTDTAAALIPNVIAGRIANRLDLMGPSYTVDGACASSLLAVEIAMRELRSGECDLALVGGAQVTTPIPILTLFCQLNALSRQQQLRAFDASADGTILGEGIGMVVLKRREEAERDGDRIYAVIKGVGTSSDGRAVSVMAPRREGQALALRRAYDMAGISPRTVELIEAHGTATLVGDMVEMQSLADVFGPRGEGQPWCAIGTVKSMIGHCMPASGIAGLIKTALALYHKTLPPTLHVETPNPKLGLDTSPFYINTETRPWIHGTHEAPRRAGVNAFGFGGINAHVVLEEVAGQEVGPNQSHHLQWDSEVCIVRAESRERLLERLARLHESLDAAPDSALKDVAYTLNVATPDAPWRLSIVASSVDDLRQKLGRASERLSDPACRHIKDVRGIYFAAEPLRREGKLAFLFPGEGSQYVNMLADLCIHFPEVRACFDQIDRAYLDHPRNYLPSDVIFPRPSFSKAERAAAAQRLWQMDSAIEAVLTANHALFTLLTHLGIRPDMMLGHSTGDYAALRAAGVFDFDNDEVYTRFLQSLNHMYEQEVAQDGVPRAALLAIGADRAQVEAVMARVDGELYVAMDNCRHQTVIAGEEGAVQRAAELARAQGLIHELLSFDRAYHTPLFAAYADMLRRIYLELPIAAPAIETYSCTSMAPFPDDPQAILDLELDHWVKPVEFSKTIESLYDKGVRLFVEVGGKGNLTTFVDDILGERPYIAVPANVSRRSGIAGLNHMVGMLAAHGVAMTLDYLYERRSPRTLPLLDVAAGAVVAPKADGTRKLATGWPALALSPELVERLRDKGPRENRIDAPLPLAAPPPPTPDELRPSPIAASLDGAHRPVAPAMRPAEPPLGGALPAMPAPIPPMAVPAVTMPTPALPGGLPLPAHAMHTYLQTMDQFVAMQQELMQGYVQSVRDRQAQGGRAGAATAEVEQGNHR